MVQRGKKIKITKKEKHRITIKIGDNETFIRTKISLENLEDHGYGLIRIQLDLEKYSN